jgi:hypothetical protein
LIQNPEGFSEELPRIAIVKEVPKMERVIFRNMRDPGVTLDFHHASKRVPLQMFHLKDGKETLLPEEVVDRLNDCKVPIYAYRRDADGAPQMYVKSYRYHFQIQRLRDAS